MPSLNELKYFLTTAKTKNVSRAAELSGLSQSALSHALKRLEVELGEQLFFREKTGVHLTRAGEQFAVEARDLVEKWDSITSSLKAQENSVSGHFKIGCHPSVAIYSLPTFLKELLSTHPLIEISLHHGRSRDIAQDIIDWKLDFGLVINPPKHPDLVIKEIAKDEVTLWVSKGPHLDDTLIVENELFQTQSILKQLEKKKVKFARTIESSSLEVIQVLTANGCGVGIIPTRVAQAEAKKLKLFSSSAPIFEDRLCLIYRSRSQRQAGSRAIIDAIMDAKI
jgi:DNA-binding transcriptional LysR family regulator